jgi:hypothetical protein
LRSLPDIDIAFELPPVRYPLDVYMDSLDYPLRCGQPHISRDRKNHCSGRTPKLALFIYL